MSNKKSKYSKEDLQAKAKIILEARGRGDDLFFRFMMSMSLRTGMNPGEVLRKTQEYANGNIT